MQLTYMSTAIENALTNNRNKDFKNKTISMFNDYTSFVVATTSMQEDNGRIGLWPRLSLYDVDKIINILIEIEFPVVDIVAVEDSGNGYVSVVIDNTFIITHVTKGFREEDELYKLSCYTTNPHYFLIKSKKELRENLETLKDSYLRGEYVLSGESIVEHLVQGGNFTQGWVGY